MTGVMEFVHHELLSGKTRGVPTPRERKLFVAPSRHFRKLCNRHRWSRLRMQTTKLAEHTWCLSNDAPFFSHQRRKDSACPRKQNQPFNSSLT